MVPRMSGNGVALIVDESEVRAGTRHGLANGAVQLPASGHCELHSQPRAERGDRRAGRRGELPDGSVP